MPAAATLTPIPKTSVTYSESDGFFHKKWSVRECRELIGGGLLDGSQYELIEGVIVAKTGQGREHIVSITRILAALNGLFDPESLQNQASIGLGDRDAFNDPEPDVAVLRGSVRDYLDHEPDPAADLLLVIEVSQTTLQGDTITKPRVYGKHDVPEYWVVALSARQVIVHRQPNGLDGYFEIAVYGEADSISPLARPGATIRVADLLP
jgi:Uma2 family endonuclease